MPKQTLNLVMANCSAWQSLSRLCKESQRKVSGSFVGFKVGVLSRRASMRFFKGYLLRIFFPFWAPFITRNTYDLLPLARKFQGSLEEVSRKSNRSFLKKLPSQILLEVTRKMTFGNICFVKPVELFNLSCIQIFGPIGSSQVANRIST